MFKGSYVALVTPFKNGKLDEKKLQSLVNWQIEEGTDGIVPMGTTGESATVSRREHARIIELTLKAAKGRVPVIAGSGTNSTADTISLAREAKSQGANGVLLINPYYNRPTQEGLKAHFSAVAEAVDIPMILYNIPSRTGVNMLPSTVAALAKGHRNIVGIKEATASMDQASEILELLGTRFCLLSGEDTQTLPLMALGAQGVISVAANLVPRDIKKLCELALDHQFQRARELHWKLYPLIRCLFLETNPGPVKTAMYEAGLLGDESLRLPMVTVSNDTRQKIRSALKAYGIRVRSSRP